MKPCHAETYCNALNAERSNCSKYCIGYVQLQNIYEMSNMPKRFQYPISLDLTGGENRESFLFLRNWMQDVKQHVKNGDGLYIFSDKKGNGKTTWACKIMNDYFKQVALKNNLRCRGLYVNVPQFFHDLKNSFDNPTTEFQEFMDNIRKADLVIWDDIGTESPTTFVRDTLYTFINYRYSEMKSQIFTSNVLLEELENPAWLGERTVSRIRGVSDLVEFIGEDRR